ncbi:MAG: LacI family DNA-binding transcriptional regulator [Solobacterium sp.]|nr:LacI family DNA-binding transcriptional regulator [Solobacterium sp.]
MSENGKKVTIQDIADSLGISRNTVSKAINNSEGLADATREKILQRAVEMGYKQFSYVSTLNQINLSGNSAAAPIIEGGGEIALLSSALLSNSHFASLFLDKFHQECAQLGFTLTMHRITPEHLQNRELPLTFDASKIKGIMCVEMFDYDYSRMICSLGLPVLFVDGPVRNHGEPLEADILMMNNHDEILRFVHLMAERGLTRIGFIGDPSHCQSFQERYNAFRLAMFNHELSVEPQYLLTGADKDLPWIAEKLESMEDYPDVFICANDFVAIEAMQMLAKKDRSLLQKVRFLGFDDSHESRIFYPTLSTIHIHTQVMAFSALHLLMSRIKEPAMDYRTLYAATDLILRESTEF